MDKMQQADPKQTGIAQLCCCTLSIPWIIVFFMYMSGGGDPEVCWVAPNELWTAQASTGVVGEYDIAAEYKNWFMIAFYVYIGLAVFQFLAGVCFLIDQAGVAKAFGCCFTLTKCTQCALWFWALFGLRFSAEGSVATGNM